MLLANMLDKESHCPVSLSPSPACPPPLPEAAWLGRVGLPVGEPGLHLREDRGHHHRAGTAAGPVSPSCALPPTSAFALGAPVGALCSMGAHFGCPVGGDRLGQEAWELLGP